MSTRAWGGRHEGSGGGGDSGGFDWDAAAAGGGGGGWAMAVAAAGLALTVGAGGAGFPGEGRVENCGIVGVVSSGEKGADGGGVIEYLYEVRVCM